MTAHEKAVEAAKQATHPLMDEAESSTAAITAYLASMEAQGWVMVPREPTKEMLAAVWSIRASNGKDVAATCYEALLDAAKLAAKDGQP